MKKWGFFIVIILILGFVCTKLNSNSQGKVDFHKYIPEKVKLDHSIKYKAVKKIKLDDDQVYQGNLLLVNKDYPVHERSVKSDVVNLFSHRELINGYGLLDSHIKLSKAVALKFMKMIAAANNDGVNHFSVSSGFRDFAEQTTLYQEMGSHYALPAGYSEHNLGLSLDVGSTQTKMDVAAEGRWIQENAWKYGFILRYPKDKTSITGIEYEPWHIRYVGLPHSAIMKEKNLALEEYEDYLKENKNISVSIEGKTYSISYYPVGKSQTIEVPENHSYEISGNNMDGIIVTAVN